MSATDAAPTSSTLPYRRCVGIALFDQAGRVFVARRRGEVMNDAARGPYRWQMPQGGIDPGEAPLDAAIRELFEETSIRSAKLLAEAPDWLSYDLPREMLQRPYRGSFRGQTQRWFAFRFTGDDSEINVKRPGGGKHHAEFDEWRWEDLARTPELIIPFKRPVYEQVARTFARFAGAAPS
jgi:putative (di)nucleoside polyphosphate hydrolase